MQTLREFTLSQLVSTEGRRFLCDRTSCCRFLDAEMLRDLIDADFAASDLRIGGDTVLRKTSQLLI